VQTDNLSKPLNSFTHFDFAYFVNIKIALAAQPETQPEARGVGIRNTVLRRLFVSGVGDHREIAVD